MKLSPKEADYLLYLRGIQQALRSRRMGRGYCLRAVERQNGFGDGQSFGGFEYRAAN